MILGVDAGNRNVKIFGPYGEHVFTSEIGEYRERKLKDKFSNDDMIFQFNGKKGFAGTLAKYESQFTASRMGDSKAHEEMLIRTLLGLHRYAEETEFGIVVGQPISMHTDSEKRKMKDLLEGIHEISINEVTKKIHIKRAEIAAEGGAAFWASPRKGLVRVLDVGSGTVNGATLNDGRYIDRDSFTIKDGLETLLTNDVDSFVRKIALHALKQWNMDDLVLLCGGGAEKTYKPLKEYFSDVQQILPKVQTRNENGGIGQKQLKPVFANAVGFYNIARKVINDELQN